MANKRICTCADCGKTFEGWPCSRYCLECAIKRRKGNQQNAVQRHRKQVQAERAQREPAAKPVKKKPNTEQCKGCKYWRYFWCAGDGKTASRGCHYMLDTEKRRERDGDICYSRTPKDKK